MPSIKQIQNRLLNKKSSLSNINSSIDRSSSDTSKIILKRLYQEKASLGIDIRKLERQLSTAKNTNIEKLAISTEEIEEA